MLKLINNKVIATLYIFPAAAFFALLFAYISEYGFGLKPCLLCVFQRVPFYLALIISAACFYVYEMRNMGKNSKQNNNLLKYTALAYSVIFIIGAVIAFYHVGVEKGIFHGPSSCSGQGLSATLEDVRKRVLSGPVVPCNVPAFIFLRISMAGWNMFYSLALSLYALYLFISMRNASR